MLPLSNKYYIARAYCSLNLEKYIDSEDAALFCKEEKKRFTIQYTNGPLAGTTRCVHEQQDETPRTIELQSLRL